MDRTLTENRIRTCAAGGSFRLEYNPSQVFSTWDQKRHSNASFELHIILSGTCTVCVREKTLSLSGGDVLIILPGNHHMSSTGPGDFSHVSVSFAREESTPFLPGVTDYFLLRADAETFRAAGALMKESVSFLPCRDEMLSLLLKETFLCVLRRCSAFAAGAEGTGAPQPSGKDPSVLFDQSRIRNDLIDDFFEKRHTESVCEAQLADLLHVSVRQLSRILKKNYGMNFSEMLTAARMDHAAWLLGTTDLSVSAISEAVGFSSEGSLFRLFKSRYNKTPRQYRLGV